MREILVSKLYPVNQISNTNDKVWKMLAEYMKDIPVNEEVVFDFQGIQLNEPWVNEYFKAFMRDNRVYLKVYTSEHIKRTVNVMCAMGGIKTDRVINIDIVYKEEKVDKKAERIENRIRDLTVVNNGNAIIHLYKGYDQLSSTNYIQIIEKIVREMIGSGKANKFILNTGRMFIQDNIREALAKSIIKLNREGIQFDVYSDDETTYSYIKKHQCISGTKGMHSTDKYNLIKGAIPKNTIGLLSRYKKSRKRDAFGCSGNGEVVSCKPAIFRGLELDGDKVLVRLEVYEIDTFNSPLYWAMEHDGDEHPGLEYKSELIAINDIGFGELFAGGLYHFNLPLQFKQDGMHLIYRWGDNDKIQKCKVILPEYFLDVVLAFNLDVNTNVIKECIEHNKRMLEI